MPVLRVLRGRGRPGGSSSPSALIQTVIDGLLDASEISFYTGTRPVNTSTAPSGVTLLATLTVAYPNGAPLANLINSTSIALVVLGGEVYVAGTATWCRLRNPDSTAVYDADVGTGSGVNKVTVNTAAWSLAQTLTALVITVTESGNPSMNLNLAGSMTIA